MKLAGIEIGGTKLQVVLGDENGAIQERYSHVIDARQGASAIRKLIEEDIRMLGILDGVGVGFGGPVDRITGEIWTSYHVAGWKNFNIVNWLNEFTGAPVLVENDANVAALGESMAGAGRHYNIVFYVTLGSGVGGGLTVGGKIYHGRLPGEVEFGHVRLDRSGRTVQESCSGWAVNDKILRALDAQPKSKLSEFARLHPGAEARALLPAMEAGDADALEIFDSTTTDLAFGLSHVVHLFHPDTIIVGGGLSLTGEILRKKIEKELRLYIMDAFQPGPVIQLSKLSTDAVPVGALLLAAQNLKSVN